MNDALADGEDRVDHRDVDELPAARLPRAQHRRQNADRKVEGRDGVADAGTDLRWMPSIGPRNAHHPAHGLGNDVVGRPISIGTGAGAWVAESANSTIDKARMAFAQKLIGQSKSIHHPGPEVLDQ